MGWQETSKKRIIEEMKGRGWFFVRDVIHIIHGSKKQSDRAKSKHVTKLRDMHDASRTLLWLSKYGMIKKRKYNERQNWFEYQVI